MWNFTVFLNAIIRSESKSSNKLCLDNFRTLCVKKNNLFWWEHTLKLLIKNYLCVRGYFTIWVGLSQEIYFCRKIQFVVHFWMHFHCLKSVQLRSFSGPYLVQMLENTYQRNPYLDSFYAVFSIFGRRKIFSRLYQYCFHASK